MLEILKYPDPRLGEISLPVDKFDADLHRLLDDMATTMYGSNGVGLAAAQVGKLLRLFIVDIGWSSDAGEKKLWEFINPKLSDGHGRITFEEGCLSIPGLTEEVTRKARIHIDYQDRFGNPQSLDAEELLAVALQHEYDHLDGILFIDRLSLIKRRLTKRKLSKSVTL